MSPKTSSQKKRQKTPLIEQTLRILLLISAHRLQNPANKNGRLQLYYGLSQQGLKQKHLHFYQ